MSNKTEKQKMLAGDMYDPYDAELSEERRVARDMARRLNATVDDIQRESILRGLFGGVGEDPRIHSPFYCDYGKYIFLGDHVYMNVGCVILDCNEVHIGDNVMFGPYVQIYAAYHPTLPEERSTGLELSSPIRIEKNVWIGGGAIVLPGVTIGENTTIGAGSVVTKDIPPNVVAAGNPCRVLRETAGE